MNFNLKKKYDDLIKTAKILNEVRSTVNNRISMSNQTGNLAPQNQLAPFDRDLLLRYQPIDAS